MVYAGEGAAATAAIIAGAIKASGAIVRVDLEDFASIVDWVDKPLVVFSESSFLGTRYHYLTGYKGLVFYTRSSETLLLKSGARADPGPQDLDSRVDPMPPSGTSRRMKTPSPLAGEGWDGAAIFRVGTRAKRVLSAKPFQKALRDFWGRLK